MRIVFVSPVIPEHLARNAVKTGDLSVALEAHLNNAGHDVRRLRVEETDWDYQHPAEINVPSRLRHDAEATLRWHAEPEWAGAQAAVFYLPFVMGTPNDTLLRVGWAATARKLPVVTVSVVEDEATSNLVKALAGHIPGIRYCYSAAGAVKLLASLEAEAPAH